MKYFISFLIIICISTNSLAQSCAYAGAGSCESNLQDPAQIAIDAVSASCNTLRVPYIYVYRADISNACATRASNGVPIITYNPNFLNFLSTSNPWAPVSVLAHEVGHHYNADISWYGQFRHSWTRELQADYVSGYVLYKLGASLPDALSAFSVVFDWYGSHSHPDTPRRIEALTAGYNRAALGF